MIARRTPAIGLSAPGGAAPDGVRAAVPRRAVPGVPARAGAPGAYGIIRVCLVPPRAMEAERLNQIATTLADLRTRAAELRRYL